MLTNSSLWAIDAQSLKEGALGLWDKSKDVADTVDRKSTRLNSSHSQQSRMPSSA